MTLQQGRNCFDGLKMPPSPSFPSNSYPNVSSSLIGSLIDYLIEGSYIDWVFLFCFVFFSKDYADFGNVSNVLTNYKNRFIDRSLIIKKK